jgi:hypothetical protein
MELDLNNAKMVDAVVVDGTTYPVLVACNKTLVEGLGFKLV